MQCPDCGSGLGSKAIRCRCGWSAVGGSIVPLPHIACSYMGCGTSAVCRVWTKTGWANVCLKHYEVIETVKRPSINLTTQEIKERYAARYIPQIKAERIPGADDEQKSVSDLIPLDDLERELMERANP